MSSRARRNWKGHCAMCSAQKGKMRGMGRAEREPKAVIRALGKKRKLRRGDLGDAQD